MKLFAPFLILALTLSAAAGEDEIKSAEKAWIAAVKSRNVAQLEKLFTPELIYGHASGAIETKQKYLDRLKSGKQRYDSMEIESMKIVMYGTTAVAHSVARFTGVNDSGPFNDHLMLLHTWVKQKGAWHLAAHQTAKLP